MTPLFFETQDRFRNWLVKNYDKCTEQYVGFYKVKSEKKSMTWSQAVDQALCFGWIDGVKFAIDADSYKIRFTPRRKNSIWSAVNIAKVRELTEKGLMTEAGIKSFSYRTKDKSRIYAFEKKEINFEPKLEKLFKANKAAWQYFTALAPTYRKPSANWVMSAKQETTKLKRLHELILDSENQTNKWKDNKYKKK